MSHYSHTPLLDMLIVFGAEATPVFIPRMILSRFVWVRVILALAISTKTGCVTLVCPLDNHTQGPTHQDYCA